MQVVEDLVKTEAAMDRPSSPRKRGIEEVEDYDHSRKVKTERSWSHGSHSSHTTTKSSVGVKMEIDVKMEIEDHHAIDEETSNAASILNGVSMDRRRVFNYLNFKLIGRLILPPPLFIRTPLLSGHRYRKSL